MSLLFGQIKCIYEIAYATVCLTVPLKNGDKGLQWSIREIGALLKIWVDKSIQNELDNSHKICVRIRFGLHRPSCRFITCWAIPHFS